MDEKLLKKYGNDLIEVAPSTEGNVKFSIGLALASSFGAGMPGGYKPKLYVHENTLVKYVNKVIEEYPIVEKKYENDYLYVQTKSAVYKSVKPQSK